MGRDKGRGSGKGERQDGMGQLGGRKRQYGREREWGRRNLAPTIFLSYSAACVVNGTVGR